MSPSEKIAIAAHLHVLMRRKLGRVTDIEWMAANAEYADEVVRVARAGALQGDHADLAEWATKLENAMRPEAKPSLVKKLFSAANPEAAPPQAPAKEMPEIVGDVGLSRYIRGIR